MLPVQRARKLSIEISVLLGSRAEPETRQPRRLGGHRVSTALQRPSSGFLQQCNLFFSFSLSHFHV
jgi:hypothetical protein